MARVAAASAEEHAWESSSMQAAPAPQTPLRACCSSPDELHAWRAAACGPRRRFINPAPRLLRDAAQEEDWRARESAILALGAISEGCAAGLLGHLGEMVGVLLPKLLDGRPLVRSISCWALSRYAHWIVQAGREPAGQQQFDIVIAVRSAPHPLPLRSRIIRHACMLLSTLPLHSLALVAMHMAWLHTSWHCWWAADWSEASGMADGASMATVEAMQAADFVGPGCAGPADARGRRQPARAGGGLLRAGHAGGERWAGAAAAPARHPQDARGRAAGAHA